MTARAPYLLIVRPRPSNTSTAEQRLRRAMKLLKRVYGCDVTHLEEIENEDVAGILGAATVLRRRRERGRAAA